MVSPSPPAAPAADPAAPAPPPVDVAPAAAPAVGPPPLAHTDDTALARLLAFAHLGMVPPVGGFPTDASGVSAAAGQLAADIHAGAAYPKTQEMLIDMGI